MVKKAVSTLNPAGSKGAKAHFKKMATQTSQVNSGQGAMTGGFATSPGAPVITNKGGAFLVNPKKK